MLFLCDRLQFQELVQLPFKSIQMLSRNHSEYNKVIPTQNKLDDLIFIIQ